MIQLLKHYTNKKKQLRFYLSNMELAMSLDNMLLLYANKNGVDQTAHRHSLVSTFVLSLNEG